jgi:amidohydrolase
MREVAKRRVEARVRADADSLVALSRRIHARPELGFEEVEASGWISASLERAGFDVERGVFDLPTAFVARSGTGPLHLAICAEYDALPEIGHACGHNLIAAIAVGAGGAVRALVDELGITLTVLGTPAEELGNGKALLLERGAFEGVHAAMMVHPAPLDVLEPPLLAFAQFDVEYRGREAEAFDASEPGVSAADALTVAQVAIGLLRAELGQTDRVHGIITHAGTVLGAIPGRACGTYMVRTERLAELRALRDRVRRCFEAGALATGANLKFVEAHDPYADMRHDRALAAIYARNAEAVGRVFPDLGRLLERGTGSSDMGNVSQVVPAIHPAIGIDSFPAVNHQPEFTAHCVTPAADRALVDGATALAWTIVDTAADESIRRRLLRAGENPERTRKEKDDD